MSLVPMLFRDWWDDMDKERPSRLFDQHFGNVLNRDELFSNFQPMSLLRSAGYFRPWRQSITRQNSGSSTITADPDKVQVVLDVQQFSPSEITVKVMDNSVIIEGKHDEKQDEHGYISRHFKRKYLLPKDVVTNEVVSSLSSDGVLTVTAPKRSLHEGGARNVPIIQTGTPAVSTSGETSIKVEQAT
ncbi:hypothetical protein AAG570_007900 [Ranatra chinensis]|uniref:SHSP domain-containing protein n=1 Tax=Ranatra chinensis TaxID=642074 RepID=A0ABD0YEZ1_9HEMI